MGKKPAQTAKAAESKKAAKDEVITTKKVVKAKKKPVEVQARSAKTCKMKSCKRGYRAKGYCVSHYREWRNGKFGIARYKVCSNSECKKPQGVNRHGYCEAHFQNYYVKGIEEAKPAPVAAPAPAAKVEKTAAAS